MPHSHMHSTGGGGERYYLIICVWEADLPHAWVSVWGKVQCLVPARVPEVGAPVPSHGPTVVPLQGGE